MSAPLPGNTPQPEPEPSLEAFEPTPAPASVTSSLDFNAVGPAEGPPPPASVADTLRGAFDPDAFASSGSAGSSSAEDSEAESSGSDDRVLSNANPLNSMYQHDSDDTTTDDDDHDDDDAGDPVPEESPAEEGDPSLRVDDVSPRGPASGQPSPSAAQQLADPRHLSPQELPQMFAAAVGRPEAAQPPVATTDRQREQTSLSPTSRLTAPIAAKAPSRTQADIEFSQGKHASGKGNWAAAVEAYERYLELVTPQHGRYVQALADLGGCYAQLSEFARAEAVIQDCISHLHHATGGMTQAEERMLQTVNLTLQSKSKGSRSLGSCTRTTNHCVISGGSL